nr:ATP-binding protein [Neobacillus sp. Marseille-Q6967]
MKKHIMKPKLMYEEKKAVALFLWLFNIFFIGYELIYYFLLPDSQNGVLRKPEIGLGYWYYILIFLLLPLSAYLIKKGNPYLIKYVYLWSFIVIDVIHNMLIYMETPKEYASGHIVEVLFILFSPIFVNKQYLLSVSLGMVSKYIFTGIILQDTLVLVPTSIYIVLSGIAFVIFIRINSYIRSLTRIHEELLQKEKLAVIGQMAAAIAHEIRNPLSSLKGFTQLQEERYPNMNDFYPIMISEIDRINSIVNDLMTLGKPKDLQFLKANIEEIIAYTLSIIQYQAEKQEISVETTIAGPLPPLECDSKQLKQVFINLLKNAVESMPNGGKLEIKVKVVESKKMLISIEDEGFGIEDKNILNLGEPFFTTKQNGTGLGLLVTNQIINDHRGKLKFESKLGIGTKVEVILPIKQK